MKFIWIMVLLLLAPDVARAANVSSKFATVDNFKMHYLITGKGEPVVLLHGFGESSRMWLPLIKELEKNHTVIAPDLRGAGQSAVTKDGYSKAVMAQDIHALVTSLGYKDVQVVGHDIGLMVAYAYAAQYPTEVKRVVLMDAFLPGIGDWQTVWHTNTLWHFHFYGEVPEALVKGREGIYLSHFWDGFAADPKHSLSQADRAFYTKEYAQAGHTHAGMEWFRNFEQDGKDFATYGQTKLTMPMLVLSGEKAGGQFLIDQGKMVDSNVEGVIVKGSGHWLMEEAPAQVVPALVAFLNKP